MNIKHQVLMQCHGPIHNGQLMNSTLLKTSFLVPQVMGKFALSQVLQ